jgi:asparagine synthase (glutamine-hydrolysing)
MCGIAGIVNFDRENRCDRNLLEQMVRSLAHRGADDRGILAAPEVGSGMTRLSIINVAGGHHPLVNEEDVLWLF